jgi:hypothetical protein
LVAFHPAPAGPGTKGEVMADTPPPAGLLDRAGRVFSLAAQLAHAFANECERQGDGLRRIDPAAWGRRQPAFDVFCEALLDLRDEMQNPPDGFAPVAEVLMEAARVAGRIRDVMQTTEGQTWQSFLDFRFDLNSIVASGNEAIRAVTEARRPDGPFAFAGQPATVKGAGIDTTPAVPRPPATLVEAAARAIPGILANIQPDHDGAVGLESAAHLASRVQKAGHTLAAAQWAIHEAVRAGRLRAGLVEVELPSMGVPNPEWGGPAIRWHGGGRGTKVIPKGKPTPFDCFKVVATQSLWTWWRSLDVTELGGDRSPAGRFANPHEATPAVTASADRQAGKHRSASPASPEDRVGGPDPLAALEQIVTSLAVCVDPLRTLFLESYSAAEERWRQARQDADRALPSAVSRVRRWFATNLPPAFHLTAEQELTAAEEAVIQFLTCPIPEPALPVGWHEDENGKLHTPVGGSGPAHREACQRLRQAAATSRQAVSRLTRWRDWETRQSDGDRAVNPSKVSAPKDKRSSERGEGRVRLISALTKHHRYADGGCLNQEPIGNNELARLADVSESTASAFFKHEFKGYAKYRAICRDAGRLADSFKALNGEFSPHDLYGRRPPGEDDRDGG